METLLHKALSVLSPEQVWVNPDCGLKTRRWEEVAPALENLVAATRRSPPRPESAISQPAPETPGCGLIWRPLIVDRASNRNNLVAMRSQRAAEA